MTKTNLPSPAVRNTIAFVDFFGTFPGFVHYETRRQAERYEYNPETDEGAYTWVQFNHNLDIMAPGGTGRSRYYLVTEAGREVAAKGSLSKVLQWLKEQGFEYRPELLGRKPKPSYFPGFVHPETGEEAWISGFARVYVRPGRESGQGWRSELRFEARNG